MKIVDNKTLQSILYSFLSIIGIYYIFNGSNYNNILYILLFFIFFYIKDKLLNQNNKISFIYSLITSIIFMIGQEIYYYHSLTRVGEEFIYYIFYFIGIIYVFYTLYELINRSYQYIANKKKKVKEEELTTKEKKMGLLGLICTHLIVYLAYFPGLFDYDITTQISMPLTNFHPIVHTAIWWFFRYIEKFTNIKDIGVVLYTLFQLAIVIGTYCYFLNWENKNKFHKKFIIGTYLYFALNPILLVFSLCTTKDVIFGMFVLLFLTSIYDIYHENNKINKIKYILFGIGCCLFRNNMIYVILLFLIYLLLFFKKKKINFITLSIIITIYIFNNLICPTLGVQKGLMQEMMSIPLSQMSYVYLYEDTYTEKEKELIQEYVPGILKYNPRFADAVKHNFNETKFKKNKLEFISLYTKGFINHPLRYIYVFLDMNIVYWYPNAETIDQYSQKIYIEDRTYNEYVHNIKQERKSPLKNTYKFLHTFANFSNPILKIPLLANYFLLNFSFWFMMVMSYLYCLKKKEKSFLLVLSILIFLFLTYMLGPVSNFRYIYPYYLSMPLLLGIVLYSKKKEDE